MDPSISNVLIAGITSGVTLASTLLVQRHTTKKETAEDRTEAESARIADIRAFYGQLLSDRDTRISELRADLAATEADLRLHNDALLKAATSQEQMVEMMRSLLAEVGS
jgi:hypothetical protein